MNEYVEKVREEQMETLSPKLEIIIFVIILKFLLILRNKCNGTCPPGRRSTRTKYATSEPRSEIAALLDLSRIAPTEKGGLKGNDLARKDNTLGNKLCPITPRCL